MTSFMRICRAWLCIGLPAAAFILGCATPKVLLRSEVRGSYQLDAARTVYVAAPDDPVLDWRHISPNDSILIRYTPKSSDERTLTTIDELASQLRSRGFMLTDSPERADVVIEISFGGGASDSRKRFLREAIPRPPLVIRFPLYRIPAEGSAFSVSIWPTDRWLDLPYRLNAALRAVRQGDAYPDSLNPVWTARIDAPPESLDFHSRVQFYVELLLSSYGKTVTEEHYIRLGPPRKK